MDHMGIAEVNSKLFINKNKQAGAWCFGALLTVWEVLATALVHHVSPVRPV